MRESRLTRIIWPKLGKLRHPYVETAVHQTTVEDVPDPIRFGRLIAARRGELGLTQTDISDRGGPSDATIRKLERGETKRPDIVTLTNLEKALEWKKGSASRAFQGGEPEPLPSSSVDGELSAWTSLRPPQPITGIDQGVVLRTDGLAELTRASRALDDLPDNLEADLNQRIIQLRHIVDRLTRAWLIRQAEVARSSDSLSGLVLTHDDQLRRPPPEDAPSEDAEDLRYLRWLTGYIDPESAEARLFERRFRNSMGE